MDNGKSCLLERKPSKTKWHEITLKGACVPSYTRVTHGLAHGHVAQVLEHTQSHGCERAPVALYRRSGGIQRHAHELVHAHVSLKNSHGPKHGHVSARI